MGTSSTPEPGPGEPAELPEPEPDWDFTSAIPYTDDGVLLGEQGVQRVRRELGWGPKPDVPDGDR
ncbi:hypothetical protein [Pseudofrankia sp. BMG5.37]|uniref:hypothetical protein n=1 Tax=Pseudofrankia sp. BMG5.37 TaxID=3050035 RepID=UPI002895EE6B|nr:hypothetical protein [Pseudofrankia sp. BMG5.37]MDT3441307.1 hypothetical protein [Pseudofrankia sp. BMG5.37]